MLDNIEFIIPCAGKSTRSYPHSKGLPHKSLLPFGSGRVIDYVLKQIFDVGGRHITIVCSSQTVADVFKEALSPCPEIEQKMRDKGLTEIADAIADTEIPKDAHIQYVVQQNPLGTAHVLGLAHRLSPDRHGCLIFPDDIYLCKDKQHSHLQKLLHAFAQNEKQILLTGIYQDDVRSYSIIENGRLIEKPQHPSNHIGGFSPMILPKAVMDDMSRQLDSFEKGQFHAHLVGGEWVYTDGVNEFLNHSPEAKDYTLRMFLKSDEDEYRDVGTLPLYEIALLETLLTLSRHKKENTKWAQKFLSAQRICYDKKQSLER